MSHVTTAVKMKIDSTFIQVYCVTLKKLVTLSPKLRPETTTRLRIRLTAPIQHEVFGLPLLGSAGVWSLEVFDREVQIEEWASG